MDEVTIREATPDDRASIVEYLSPHITKSMFLLGNLDKYGTDNKTHPFGTQYFLIETNNTICGVFGFTNGGYMMCQIPELSTELANQCLAKLSGRHFVGITGDATQVTAFKQAMNFPDDAWLVDMVEPLYSLETSLIRKDTTHIRRPVEDDLPLLAQWFGQYERDTGLIQINSDTLQKARDAVDLGQVRLLIEGYGPTAMTGLNARYGNTVQVGGVYVPAALRGKGRAGRVVAAHLAELKGLGIDRAILFSASQSAARAYEKIGFGHIGEYQIALLVQETIIEVPNDTH